jgi:hypothetical protein
LLGIEEKVGVELAGKPELELKLEEDWETN